MYCILCPLDNEIGMIIFGGVAVLAHAESPHYWATLGLAAGIVWYGLDMVFCTEHSIELR